MCGITGFVDKTKLTTTKELDQMTEVIAHRGPDGHGTGLYEFNDSLVGFGHRRLSIIDLTETGKQPMDFEHLSICFNGEIYNYQDIKSELSRLGHKFKGNSDTEMLIHAYAEWSISCLEKFRGMFAFALLDKRQEKLFLARDRAGIKPLFVYFKDDLLLFGSELKSFHAHSRFEKTLNLNAASAFMQYGNVPTPHCIFNFCHKVKPGHYEVWDLNQLNHSETRYWSVYDAYNTEKFSGSFEEAKTKTSTILKEACELRMVSDVPVGVFLSGGYDSACVTALLQHERTEKLKTFTISVPDIGLNEAPYAQAVAKHLGTDHTEIACSQDEATALIENLPFYFDEPFADSSAIPTTLVSLMARKHVTVALSADAGDEVFAGYNRYDYLMRYGKRLNQLPPLGRKFMASTLDLIPANSIPILKNKYNFHNRYEKLKGLLRNPSPEQIMLSLTEQFTEKQLNNILKNPVTHLETAYTTRALKEEFNSPLAYMMAIDYETYLVDDILQKVDRSTMSASLEGREPFLDHSVIEWAATLPDTFKYNNGIKKYILREIVHDFIPKELMDRPKMGFAIPIESWLQREFKQHVDYYLQEQRIEQQAIFNVEAIQKLKREFYRGKKELAVKLWYVLMFQMWYERWFNK